MSTCTDAQRRNGRAALPAALSPESVTAIIAARRRWREARALVGNVMEDATG